METNIQLTFVPLPHQTGGVMASTQKPFEMVKEMVASVRSTATSREKLARYDTWTEYEQVG